MLRLAALRLHDATENVKGVRQFSISAREGQEEKQEPRLPLVTAANGTVFALCVPEPALPAVITPPPFVAETWKAFVVRPVAET